MEVARDELDINWLLFSRVFDTGLAVHINRSQRLLNSIYYFLLPRGRWGNKLRLVADCIGVHIARGILKSKVGILVHIIAALYIVSGILRFWIWFAMIGRGRRVGSWRRLLLGLIGLVWIVIIMSFFWIVIIMSFLPVFILLLNIVLPYHLSHSPWILLPAIHSFVLA